MQPRFFIYLFIFAPSGISSCVSPVPSKEGEGGEGGSTCDHIRDFLCSQTPKVHTGLNFVSRFLKTLTEGAENGRAHGSGFCLQLLRRF